MFENTQKEQTNPDGIFDSIEKAEGKVYNTQWIEPGVYPLLYVDTLKIIQTRKGDTMFLAEFDVLVSETDEHPKGTRVTWCANFRHEPSPKNVKVFLATLMNEDPSAVTAEAAKLAVSDKNPCHGRLIRAEAFENDKNFTIVNWRSIPNKLQDQANALREDAGFSPF